MSDKQKMADELLEWIKAQCEGNCECEPFESGKFKGVNLKTEFAAAQVSICFMDYAVVEYRITNLQEENVFYLHFELNNLDHAKELFVEMNECLGKQRSYETKHIVLCCSCGLTTSYFTMKLNDAAAALDLKMDFEAVPYDFLYEKAADKDAVLLAPQISYQYKNVCSVLKDKIVLKIPVQIFSTYDGAAMITMLKEEFEKREAPQKQQDQGSIEDIENGSVLIVSVINMERRNQIAYRIYDHGKMTAEKQITKEKYRIDDILDVIQLVTRMNSDIQKICLVTPGMVIKGRLTYEDAGIFDQDVDGMIEERFGISTYVFNNADMIALGYAAAERNGQNCAFYFVPTGDYAGSIGLVMNGQLVKGARRNGSHQLDTVTNITTFPQNPFALVRTPEGNVELAARYLTGLYAYTGIEHIAYYSSMIPDPEELKKKMTEFIDEKYLPEIVRTESVRGYLYDGVLRSIGEHDEEDG